jgi:N-acylglucosamine 2-epimerase
MELSSAQLDQLIATYRDGLLDDTLPFWIEHCVDREHGGFMMALDQDGTVIDTDKGMWQQCRFTWLLGHLYNNVERRQEWLDLARHGIDFIRKHGFDDDGRMFFHVTREGRPIRKRRYAFTETFATIAFAAYAKAADDDQAANDAVTLFQRYNDYLNTPGAMAPKYADTRPLKSIGAPMINIDTCQVLRETIDFGEANEWIDRAIDEIRQDFVKPRLEAVMETVGVDGEISDHFDGRTLNPGHAIEAAWFIMREGKYRGDRGLIQLGCQMLDWMWTRGWDRQHGGMLYFVDLNGLPVQEYWHDMKFWWPHNETIIATLLAWTLTGEGKYAEWHTKVHDWAYQHFPDSQHGEWFGYLHRDGSQSVRLKGNLWKGPFHLPRMQCYCWQLLKGLTDK